MPAWQPPSKALPSGQPHAPTHPDTLPVIGRIKVAPEHRGWFVQIRQHAETIALLHRLTNDVPGARHLKTETRHSVAQARKTGKVSTAAYASFFLPNSARALSPLLDQARALRTQGRGRLVADDEATRTALKVIQRSLRQHETQTALKREAERQASSLQPSSDPSLTRVASQTPDIQVLTGRTPQTADQAIALRIQAPRHPESQDHLYNGFPNEGLYELIMDSPGAAYIKSRKGGRSGQRARAGYFKVPITSTTAALLSTLKTRYGLSAATTCPALGDQPLIEAIRSRLTVLAGTYRLSSRPALPDTLTEPGQPDEAIGQPLHLPVPKGLSYLPYQKAGIYYAVRMGNALIADEPGLGKTIQAIGTSNAVPEARRILIIAPASLKINWQREWQKWCTKGLRVDRISGGKPDDWPRPVDDTGQPRALEVVVMNFDLVEQHHARLTEQAWDMLIVDEAHALKTRDTKRTKAILGHGTGRNHTPGIAAKRTLLLTGTPILNRPAEIFSLANALDPDFFSDAFQFERRYCNGRKTDYGWDARGASNLPELQRELRSRIMVRRQKSQVLKDLPPKTRQLIELDHPAFARANGHFAKLEQSAQTIKDCFAKRDALNARIDATPATDTDALARYAQQVRQLEREARVAFFQMSEVRKETALMKVPQVMDLIKTTLDNGKLILFCHHAEVVEAYTDALNQHFRKQAGKRGTPKTMATVTGKTPNDQRQLEADRFQEDPDCQVFIGTIQAAGTGLTLTSASAVLFAELDWVPGNMSQAEDRAHRIGQLDHVLVYHAVVEGTLDALMVRRLIEKQAVIDSALDDQVQATEQPTGLSMDDRLADWLLDLAETQGNETHSRFDIDTPLLPKHNHPHNAASRSPTP